MEVSAGAPSVQMLFGGLGSLPSYPSTFNLGLEKVVIKNILEPARLLLLVFKSRMRRPEIVAT